MIQPIKLLDCTIYLGPLEESLSKWLGQQSYSKIFIISDPNTHTHCRPVLPTFNARECTISETPDQQSLELSKTLTGCESIWKSMLDAGLDRKALVLNLGGGVIGDMGGFCAATYKRGIDFIQVPTSLLAMTDAAIGGKLGVNFQEIKNAIGVFRNPAAVFVDPVFLKTLPLRELRSGFAEMIKHALIADPWLWQQIRNLPLEDLTGYESLPAVTWLELLQASVAVKTQVVAQDPLESGIRALLNFGHTFGHALESYFLHSDEPLSHGEAVAIGMVCESDPDVAPEIAKTILRLFKHRPIPEQAFPNIWTLMQQDKKNASGTVRMAVPDAEPFSLRWLVLELEAVCSRLQTYNTLSTYLSASRS